MLLQTTIVNESFGTDVALCFSNVFSVHITLPPFKLAVWGVSFRAHLKTHSGESQKGKIQTNVTNVTLYPQK